VSVIQKFRKRYLDLDGSTKSRNRAGHSGNGSYIASKIVRFVGPSRQYRKLDDVKLPDFRCYGHRTIGSAQENQTLVRVTNPSKR
jgi:hypothetical protein